MKKAIAIFITMAITSITFADPICKEKNKIEPSMRLSEDAFNKKNAINALEKLNAMVSGDVKGIDWVVAPNNLVLIEGYLLKKRVLTSKGKEREYWQSEFCLFMKKRAIVYD
jgi:hypothetical protein